MEAAEGNLLNLAHIAPTAYLDTISKQGQILLALAHLIDDNCQGQYARWHRRKAEQGWTVILDNGLYEDEQIDSETLLHRAQSIRASVVCAPDILYNSSETIKAFKQFIRLKQDKGMVFDVMGIPQADNPVDWWECFRFMDLSRDCNYIGLSILSIPKAFNEFLGTEGITAARVKLIQQLYHYEILLGRRLTSCHLLGLGEHLGDLVLAGRLLPDTITSNDSSSMYMCGRNKVLYSRLGKIPGGKVKEKVNFSSVEKLSKSQLQAIQHNIRTAYGLANQRWVN